MAIRALIVPIALIGLLIPRSAGQAQTGQTQKGTVCVASRVDDPWWKVAPPEATETRGYKVKIDGTAAAPWPAKKGLTLDGLDLENRHILVVIDGSGKPVESVRFRFSTYSSAKLCMTYDGYQGVQLQEQSRHTPWCKCNVGK